MKRGETDLSQVAMITVMPSPVPWCPSREQGGDVPERDDDPYLDTEGVARQAGVTTESIRIYLKRSRRRISDKQELRPQDLPLPDMKIGRSPAWRQSTIESWLSRRAGPGRPRTDTA